MTFVPFIQTADEERERDVGQVPASARLSGTGTAEAEAEEAEADGTGRRDIHTAITVLGGERNERLQILRGNEGKPSD